MEEQVAKEIEANSIGEKATSDYQLIEVKESIKDDSSKIKTEMVISQDEAQKEESAVEEQEVVVVAVEKEAEVENEDQEANEHISVTSEEIVEMEKPKIIDTAEVTTVTEKKGNNLIEGDKVFDE